MLQFGDSSDYDPGKTGLGTLRSGWRSSWPTRVAGWALQGRPLALSIFGNASLIASATLVLGVILRRRREWAGCQRLFWDVIAVAMTLWIVGHLGWAYDQLVLKEQSWLKWHTLFSLCAGIGPLIALLARPHRGPRSRFVAPAAMTIGAYWLLAVFLYSYFVLVPSLMPEARDAAQERLLYFVQSNRLLLLVGMAAAVWFARGTDWRSTYLRMAVGVGIGFVLRLGTNQAIARGVYQVGSFHDLAWIAPWLCYAWAAAEAPASPPRAPADRRSARDAVGDLLVVPALLIPLIGYGVLNLESAGDTVDSIRLFLTSLTTVVGLGIVTLRLAAQGTELQRADARLQLLAAATEHTGDLDPDHAARRDVRARERRVPPRVRLHARGAGGAELRRSDRAGMDHVRRDIPAEVMAKSIWRGTLDRPAQGWLGVSGGVHDYGAPRFGRPRHALRRRRARHDRRSRAARSARAQRAAVGDWRAHRRRGARNQQPASDDHRLHRADARRARRLESSRTSSWCARRRCAPARSSATCWRSRAAACPIARRSTSTSSSARPPSCASYHFKQVNIELVLRCAPHPLPVAVNREEIRQVILNLLINAEHAIASSSGSGTITVETSGNGVVQTVEVTDSGPGISPELRGRIFEPFFTTREVGEGTASASRFRSASPPRTAGRSRSSSRRSGARFRLTLPAHAGDGALAQGPAGAGVRALVVDDDAPIRKLIVRLLEKRGYEVSEAETGESAMALALDRRPGIVICDTACRDDRRRSRIASSRRRMPRARRGSSSSAATRRRCRPPTRTWPAFRSCRSPLRRPTWRRRSSKPESRRAARWSRF